MLFIKFDILDQQLFSDFLRFYEMLVKIKAVDDQKQMEFWQAFIPQKVQQQYNLVDCDDPKYDSKKAGFQQILQYLQVDLEVNFTACKKLEEAKGIVRFETGNYPYGGMDRLIYFIKTFDCVATEIYNGFDVNSVEWLDDGEFKCEVIPQ